jgi:hypothetical protein
MQHWNALSQTDLQERFGYGCSDEGRVQCLTVKQEAESEDRIRFLFLATAWTAIGISNEPGTCTTEIVVFGAMIDNSFCAN